MKKADAFAIGRLHVPSLRLMENAGTAVVKEIVRRVKDTAGLPIVIFCGKGNNGGDGFVVARLLKEKKAEVSVVLMEPAVEVSGDAKENYLRLRDIPVLSFSQFKKRDLKPAIIVDAMLGTSFKGELKGAYLNAVTWCNARSSLKVAVDIPTGLDGESGKVLTDAFKADLTVTMSNPKVGFYYGIAREWLGEVITAEIGIPKKSIEKSSGNIFLIEEADVREILPHRPVNSHKHSVGKIFILAGSKGMAGAALLSSRSAMRSGAGQVILGIPDSEYSIIAKRTLEVMPFGLASTSEGTVSLKAMPQMKKKITWATVVALGCGLSTNDETQDVIHTIVRTTRKPMVVDADALTAIAGHLWALKKNNNKSIVLTPHLGEFARLVNRDSSDIEKNKFSYTKEFAQKYGVTLVLKGAPTIIATHTGNIFVNPTGNPGMSTAGSGDVLTGMIAAFLGQGLSADAAAVAGVYMHGLAGDIAARKNSTYGMVASDMIKDIPKTFLMLG